MEGMGKEKENLEIYAKSTDAYNARDIEGCLQCWADDLKVIALPENKTVFSSKQEVREHLKKEFANEERIPTVKALDLKTDGPYVHVVEEKSRSGKPTGKMKFIYLIEDGLIATMWGEPIDLD